VEDWFIAEAPRALETVLARVKPRFEDRPKRWTQFESAVTERFPEIFRKLHQLYGWRYDFAWWLEALVAVTAEGFLDRDKRLVAMDQDRDDAWPARPGTIWAMGYVDRFCGSFDRLPETLPHLRSLGVTHLHIMPPYLRPPGGGDGGYAVSDYRTAHPALGTIEELRSAIAALRDGGIGVVLDFVANHTADDHPWAQAAKAGDPRFADRYFMFDDRTVPDRYAPFLRAIFPDRGGDAFTWRPDVAGPAGGKWVWTTFFEYQWDLDYRNPDVLIAMTGELLFLVNLGVSVVRMDATPFLWKRQGTSCENLEEAHTLLQLMDLVVEIVAPSVELLSEAIVHPDEVSRFVRPDECRLGYNPVIMSTIWEALATRDTRLLRRSLAYRQWLPQGCQWLTYLRSHDDIGWGFADEDAIHLGIDPVAHRSFLNDFYSGRFPGSVARGLRFQDNPETGDARISGTLASLAGLEAALESADSAVTESAIDRMLAAAVVMATISGIPMIYLGDEIGQLNDPGYANDPDLASDNRWAHRPRFDWQRLERLAVETGGVSRLLGGLRRLLTLRAGLEALGGGPGRITEQVDAAVLSFRRSHAGSEIEVIANLADRPAIASVHRDGHDLWGDCPVTRGLLEFGPYQVAIIRTEPAETTGADTTAGGPE
jgi:amylosucrase